MNPKPRILIVDDTEHARRINGAVLSREGYELEFASDGAEALEKVAAFQPDVILSDVVMPGMDGLEMCRAIKKNPLQRHIPVILLSSLDRKEDIVHGLDEGADEFLPKPANPRELCARVRTMLRIKKQHDELQAALKLRDDLAHMIVHDMRSPLGTIIGSAELLAIDTLPKEKSTAAIQRITKQARRLNSLADDLLIVSKIEHGRMLLNRKTFSITDALAKAVDSHGILADATAHRLEFSNAADIPPISGDPDLILRVFDNLVSNALKYSPSGHDDYHPRRARSRDRASSHALRRRRPRHTGKPTHPRL
jgi:two-component system sensor histidine kinase/response regulator